MNQSVEPVLALYQGIMEEIKARIAAIDKGTLGLLYTLPPQTVREFGFLQIRLCCELIALSCLVVHGDILESTRLRGDYQADKIMNELEALNPHCFPQTVRVTQQNGVKHLVPISNQMTKSEFIQLYRECARYLHKGSLKNLMRGSFPRQLSYPEITKRAQAIVNLLHLHIIYEPKSSKLIICELKPATQSACAVARAEFPSDPSQIPPNLLKTVDL